MNKLIAVALLCAASARAESPFDTGWDRPHELSALKARMMNLRTNHEGGELTRFNMALAHLIEVSRPAVVKISFSSLLGSSVGSGFILNAEGLVATNAHVVEGREVGQEVEVAMDQGRGKAKVLAVSSRKDLALVQLQERRAWPFLKIGDSAALSPGHMVLALGHPRGLPLSASLGIVSGKDRAIDGIFVKSVQTDAAVNPGNSGGPLLAMDGSVMGINTFIMTESGGSEGLNFAIPAETIKRVVARYQAGQSIESGWLGVTLTTPPLRGATISEVQPGSPAGKAGLKRGDVVVATDGQPLPEQGGVAELLLRISDRFAGDSVAFEIENSGRSWRTTVVLGSPPKAPAGGRPKRAPK